MGHHFYSPRNDALFKRIFGDSRDIEPLVCFLQAVLDLPTDEYDEVTIANPFLARESPDDKLGILDVRIKTRTGKIIDIEIQICDHPQIRERIVFYLARLVTEQIGEGDDYWKIQRSICIIITDFVLVTENASYHNRYTLRDPATGSQFSDLLEVDTLELPKLSANGERTELWDWLKFLDARSEEELMVLAEKNPHVKKAVAKLMSLTADEQVRMEAESREKLRRDIAAQMKAAKESGEAIGKAKGREEGLLSVARNLLDLGRPVEEIAQVTGFSREKIQSLTH